MKRIGLVIVSLLLAMAGVAQQQPAGTGLVTGSAPGNPQQKPTVVKADNPDGIGMVEERRAPFAAQQPDPKPVTLSSEASVQWLEHQRQINELQQAITNLQLKQQLLAARAGAPENYSPVGVDANRQIVYAPPPKPEAAKAQPKASPNP